MPSNSAKAAAILPFTSGIESYDMALEVYNQLEADDLPVQETLAKFQGVCVWHELEQITDSDWWSEVTQLAQNIDLAREHFGD
jgi:hypothetical protein